MMTPSQLRDKLRGPVVAMTTTFKPDLTLDLDGMRRLTEHYAEAGIPTVIVTGSTGEFFTLTDDERRAVQKTVVDAAQGRMTVIAGTAHSGSDQCLELTRYAQDIGADGVMITPPYYGTNGGGFDIIRNHFDWVTSRCDTGVIIYFSGAVLWQVQDVIAEPNKMLSLVEACNGHAAGFKDSTANFGFYRDVSRLLKDRIAVMGSAGMNYYLWGHRFGSTCCLTGLGNIWPEWEIAFCRHLEAGELEAAETIVKEKDLPYLAVCSGTRRYWACVKALQEMAGLPGGPMRAPLVSCTEDQRTDLRRVCSEIGLL